MSRFLLTLLVLTGIAWLLRREQPQAPLTIRNAGPREMRDPPRHWDRRDETLDESFPASDPPSSW